MSASRPVRWRLRASLGAAQPMYNGQPAYVATQVFAVHQCAADAPILGEWSASRRVGAAQGRKRGLYGEVHPITECGRKARSTAKTDWERKRPENADDWTWVADQAPIGSASLTGSRLLLTQLFAPDRMTAYRRVDHSGCPPYRCLTHGDFPPI